MKEDSAFENIWHVTPINDLHPHIEKTDICDGELKCICKCDPKHEFQPNGALIIIHNSFDGREGVEWVNELLKK